MEGISKKKKKRAKRKVKSKGQKFMAFISYFYSYKVGEQSYTGESK